MTFNGAAFAKQVRAFIAVLFGLRDPTVPPGKVEVILDPPQRKP